MAHRAFHEENLASHLGPGQAGDHAWRFVAFLQIVEIRRQSEIFLKMIFLYDCWIGFA